MGCCCLGLLRFFLSLLPSGRPSLLPCALALGYEGYEKYLKGFRFVSCDRCFSCRGKWDRGIASYYCDFLHRKEYIDPKARRLCDHYEEIPKGIGSVWELDLLREEED